jgi:signal peptidase I
VAGVAGDTVEVRGNRLYVNGAAAEEPWACLDARQLGYRDGGGEGRNFGPALVPAGSVFLLGDNRDNSLDSRYEGCVAVDKVKGRVMLIYWSRDPEDFNGQWRRWDAEKGTVIQGGGRFSLDGGSSVPPRRVHWGRLGPVR